MPDPVTLEEKAHDLDETGLQASADALYKLIHDALGVDWFDHKDARSYAYCSVQPYLAALPRPVAPTDTPTTTASLGFQEHVGHAEMSGTFTASTPVAPTSREAVEKAMERLLMDDHWWKTCSASEIVKARDCRRSSYAALLSLLGFPTTRGGNDNG